MAKVTFKYLSTGTLTEAQKTQYTNDIVFVASENAIYTHGKKFGFTDEEAAKINSLETAVQALQTKANGIKYFSGITDGTKIFEGSTTGSNLKFTGTGAAGVTVSADGVTVNVPDTTTAIADAKKAGTDAQSNLDAYKNTNNAAVRAAQDAADAAQSTADGKVASVAATANTAIVVGGTATAPTVGLKIAATQGNVTLSQTADGLKASVVLPENTIKGVATDEKVIALGTDKMLTSTIGLTYDSTGKKIKLTGIGGVELASIDATAFVKDGMISKDNTKFDTTTKVLTIGFNTDSGISAFDVDLSTLVDTYDGSNLKLKEVTLPTTYAAPAANDSVDVAVAKLAKGIADAKVSGVTSFGGKTGVVTLAAAKIDNGSVNLKMNGNVLGATIVGLGSAAYTESSAYATAAQGTAANSAVQNVRAANTGTYISVAAAKTDTTINLTPSVTVQAVSTATTTAKGLAEASDVKNYVDEQLTWEEL